MTFEEVWLWFANEWTGWWKWVSTGENPRWTLWTVGWAFAAAALVMSILFLRARKRVREAVADYARVSRRLTEEQAKKAAEQPPTKVQVAVTVNASEVTEMVCAVAEAVKGAALARPVCCGCKKDEDDEDDEDDE